MNPTILGLQAQGFLIRFLHQVRKPYKPNLPLGEWKNGSNSSYDCTLFLHSLLTKTKGKRNSSSNSNSGFRVQGLGRIHPLHSRHCDPKHEDLYVKQSTQHLQALRPRVTNLTAKLYPEGHTLPLFQGTQFYGQDLLYRKVGTLKRGNQGMSLHRYVALMSRNPNDSTQKPLNQSPKSQKPNPKKPKA